MFNLISDAVTSLLYPRPCSICKQSVETSADGPACRECWNKTKIFSAREVLCSKCGIFLREADQPIETQCLDCVDHFYDSARAVGAYDKALAAVVIDLKHAPAVSLTTKEHLLRAFHMHYAAGVDVIMPVPLSAKRLTERGFNQAAALAKIISKESGITLDEHSLIRKVHTPMHRVAMDKKAREATVKNAFAVTRPKFVAGKNILLIDDVFTSGSTASHCAKILKKHGAGKVSILTIARAV